jgi:hypothetical protein
MTNLFIIGAGASKSVSCLFPSLEELTKKIESTRELKIKEEIYPFIRDIRGKKPPLSMLRTAPIC